MEKYVSINKAKKKVCLILKSKSIIVFHILSYHSFLLLTQISTRDFLLQT